MNYTHSALDRRDIQIDYVSLGDADSKKVKKEYLENALLACNRFGRSGRKVISFGWQQGLSAVLEIYHAPKKDVDDYGRLAKQDASDASPEFYEECVRRGWISLPDPDADKKQSDTAGPDAL
jgi:hypothetical protein